jgi:hypothetical protein
MLTDEKIAKKTSSFLASEKRLQKIQKKPSIKIKTYSRPFFYFYIPQNWPPKTRTGGNPNCRFWKSIPFFALDESFSILFLVVNSRFK